MPPATLNTAKSWSAFRPSIRNWLKSVRADGATYAEVEESEADLDRFRSWLAKIAAQ